MLNILWSESVLYGDILADKIARERNGTRSTYLEEVFLEKVWKE